MKIVDCDYFVVGSGMAGLMSALHLATYGKVVVATKGRLQDCNTNFAQGGICCVMDPFDLMKELEQVESWGFELKGRFHISESGQMLMRSVVSRAGPTERTPSLAPTRSRMRLMYFFAFSGSAA